MLCNNVTLCYVTPGIPALKLNKGLFTGAGRFFWLKNSPIPISKCLVAGVQRTHPSHYHNQSPKLNSHTREPVGSHTDLSRLQPYRVLDVSKSLCATQRHSITLQAEVPSVRWLQPFTFHTHTLHKLYRLLHTLRPTTIPSHPNKTSVVQRLPGTSLIREVHTL